MPEGEDARVGTDSAEEKNRRLPSYSEVIAREMNIKRYRPRKIHLPKKPSVLRLAQIAAILCLTTLGYYLHRKKKKTRQTDTQTDKKVIVTNTQTQK